jgi:hypothetical protein
VAVVAFLLLLYQEVFDFGKQLMLAVLRGNYDYSLYDPAYGIPSM